MPRLLAEKMPRRFLIVLVTVCSLGMFGTVPAWAQGTADLQIGVSSPPTSVVADQTATFTIQINNIGPDPAETVRLFDHVPVDVIVTSWSDGGTYQPTNDRIVWNEGTLAPQATITETATFTPIHPASVLTDKAQVQTSSTDPTVPDGAKADTSVDPEPGVEYVSVRDTAVTPAFHSVPLGGTVQWDMFGPSVHEIEDAHGLNLIDSGPVSPIGYFRYTFHLTAEIRTLDVGFPNNNGKIVIPPVVAPTSGDPSTQFDVTWADQPLPNGIVEDIQIRRPNSSGWAPFVHGTTTLGTTFVADAGDGTYAVRDRIRSTITGTHSRFGPPVPFVVSG